MRETKSRKMLILVFELFQSHHFSAGASVSANTDLRSTPLVASPNSAGLFPLSQLERVKIYLFGRTSPTQCPTARRENLFWPRHKRSHGTTTRTFGLFIVHSQYQLARYHSGNLVWIISSAILSRWTLALQPRLTNRTVPKQTVLTTTHPILDVLLSR